MDNSYKTTPPPPKPMQSGGDEYFSDDYGLEGEEYADYESFGLEDEAALEAGPVPQGDIYQEIDKLTDLARSQGASPELLKALEEKRRLALQSASFSPEKRQELMDNLRMELSDLEGRIVADIEQAPARESLKKELQELRGELQAEVQDGDQKEAIEKQLEAAEEALTKSDLEAAEQGLEEAKEGIETAKEESPTFNKQLHEQLANSKFKATEEQIDAALQKSGLTENDLEGLRLPIPAEKSKLLLEFFKALDPQFASQFSENPYGQYAMDDLKALLQHTLGLQSSPSDKEIAEFLEPHVPVNWNVETVRKGLSPGHDGEQKKILDLLDKAVRTGDTSELHQVIWSGHNDVDRAHHVWNDVIRSIVSSIYEMADRNPHLMKRYLNLIPKQILQDFRDVVIAHSGELNEKHAGDLVTSQEAHDILDWALTDKEPPLFFSGAGTTGAPPSA